MGCLRTGASGAIVLTISLATPLASAQQGPDIASAETLFEQARQLVAQGKLDEGCPKFAESQRMAPAAGTALNLASCYEKQGKLATAWRTKVPSAKPRFEPSHACQGVGKGQTIWRVPSARTTS